MKEIEDGEQIGVPFLHRFRGQSRVIDRQLEGGVEDGAVLVIAYPAGLDPPNTLDHLERHLRKRHLSHRAHQRRQLPRLDLVMLFRPRRLQYDPIHRYYRSLQVQRP
jgi:hypothetical protein